MSNLLPAIRVKSHDQLFIGKTGDSHSDLERRYRVNTFDDDQRGFVVEGTQDFIGRKQSAEWLKANDKPLWSMVGDQVGAEGLHSHHLSPNVDLSKLKVLVEDRGLYTYIAQALGKEFGQVDYYIPDSSPYKRTSLAEIGRGLPEINRIDEWPDPDKYDLTVFPDIYDGKRQHWLRSKGYCVFGTGRSEKVELDKIGFLDLLEKAGLPVPDTKICDGVSELVSFLSRKKPGEWFIKSLNRGDLDTCRFNGRKQLLNWIAQYLYPRVGKPCETMSFLVQRKIESECEPGYDGLCLNGDCTNGMVGYEDKDKRLVCRTTEECPEILGRVNIGMKSAHKELGTRGHFSTEVRITKDGRPFFIDPTERVPSPPGGLFPKIAKNLPKAYYLIARGLLPKFEWGAKYGVELILTSPFNAEKEICVEFDESIEDHIVMKNHYRRDGSLYVVSNSNGGFWGSVVTWGGNWRACAEDARQIAKEITCEELECDTSPFDNVQASIEAGRKFGIIF